MAQNSFQLNSKLSAVVAGNGATQRSVDRLLCFSWSRRPPLSNRNVALARVWMVAPGDICETCVELATCLIGRCCFSISWPARLSVDTIAPWNMASEHSAYRRFPNQRVHPKWELPAQSAGRLGHQRWSDWLPVTQEDRYSGEGVSIPLASRLS